MKEKTSILLIALFALIGSLCQAGQWKKVGEVRNNKSTLVSSSFSSIETSRVKIVNVKKSSQNSPLDTARVGEVTIFGPSGQVKAIKAEASSVYSSGYSAAQTIDGVEAYGFSSDGAKGWASGDTPQEKPEWLEITLNKKAEINKVSLTTASRDPYRFHSFDILAWIDDEKQPDLSSKDPKMETKKQKESVDPQNLNGEFEIDVVPGNNAKYSGKVSLKYSFKFPDSVKISNVDRKIGTWKWSEEYKTGKDQNFARLRIKGIYKRGTNDAIKFSLTPESQVKPVLKFKETYVNDPSWMTHPLNDPVRNGVTFSGEIPLKSNRGGYRISRDWFLSGSLRGSNQIIRIDIELEPDHFRPE